MENNRVLIIDDDESILKAYESILLPTQTDAMSSLANFAEISEESHHAATSFDVTFAQQGLSGVELVQKLWEDGLSFTTALIDIRMPPGIDGLETARRIREIDDSIIIFIVTAYSDMSIDEIQEELQHDVQYLRKPVSREVVFQMVRDACKRWNKNRVNEQRLHDMEKKNSALEAEKVETTAMNNIQGGTFFVDGGGMPGSGESWLDLVD